MDLIYLDHSATTPVDPKVLTTMEPFMTTQFGNASSIHTFGRQARNAIEVAREQVAALIGASRSSEIVFTSGATESNNQAIKGTIAHHQQKSVATPLHLVTCATEHHAVLHPCQYLEREGIEVTYLPVDRYGRISLEYLKEAIREKTVLVSIMYVNNEIGTIHPIKEICQLAKLEGVPVHTDAVQAAGKIPIDVDLLGVDLLSLSAHKFNGPKGIGALYIQRRQRLSSLLHGGEHERNRRAGTENVAAIVGMGKAAEIALQELDHKAQHLTNLVQRLRTGILTNLDNVVENSLPASQELVPGMLSLSFTDVGAEALILRLDMEGICVSSGSACASGSLEPSHVLAQLGISPQLAQSTIRFSVGSSNTEADIDTTTEKITKIVKQIRSLP